VAPEAPCTDGGQTGTILYSYDAIRLRFASSGGQEGNMLTGAGRTVIYTAANMSVKVKQGSYTFTLTYDPEHNRMTQGRTTIRGKFFLPQRSRLQCDGGTLHRG
jgi:hypothetical protein